MTAAVPWAAAVTAVTVSVSPVSGPRVSLASTAMLVTPLSSATVVLSVLAIGLSLTGVTVTLTVAVALPPLPSLIV